MINLNSFKAAKNIDHMKVSREQFKSLILDALKKCEGMKAPDDFKARLEKVADQSLRVMAIDSYSEYTRCGCPIWEAGWTDGAADLGSESFSTFVDWYDDNAKVLAEKLIDRPHTRNSGTPILLEVID